MTKYTWYNKPVPKDIKVKQVYGIAFSETYHIILINDDNEYKLIGGKPENNETYEETLKREFLEEVNTTLIECHYLGYLLVEEENNKYAQVRMLAKIEKINDRKIDPATGKTYDRYLVDATKIKEYLNYKGTAGNLMLDEALKKANKLYCFNKTNHKEELV